MALSNDQDGRLIWRESRSVAGLSQTRMRLILPGRETLFIRASLALFIFSIVWTLCVCALIVTGQAAMGAAILTQLLFSACYFVLVEYCTTEVAMPKGLAPLSVQPRGPALLPHIRVLPAAVMVLALSLPTGHISEVIRLVVLAALFALLMLYVATFMADRWREAHP